MQPRIPEHRILEDLTRDPEGKRLVFRTEYRGESCVTRVVCAPIAPALEGLVRAMVLRGAGSAPGLDLDLVATLEGYRVRHQLGDVPWLPAVLQAGLAWPEGAGAGDGLPFVTTRWVAGQPLDQLLPLGPAEAERELHAVLEILGGLHDRCVVYGDLKPQNVIRAPHGITLIDLDTLRRVPDPLEPVPATHTTLSWAAPEQRAEQPMVWLASDLYAFGGLIEAVFGVGAVPRAWAFAAEACHRRQPADRPSARGLQAWLAAPSGPPPGWSGRPVAEATVRMSPGQEHPTLTPEPEPAPVDVDVEITRTATGVVTAPTAPVPRRNLALRAIFMSLGGAALLAGVLAMAGLGGLLWLGAQERARQEADAAAVTIMADLKTQKTQQAYNTDEVLDGIIARATEAVAQAGTARTLGALALATAWRHKWHWHEGKTAPWDEALYREDLALSERALALGRRPEALLARSLVEVGACRKAPAEFPRDEACEASLRHADAALQALPARQVENRWLRLEVQWTAVMAEGTLALRMRGKDAASERHYAAALERCRDGWTLVPEAPVNDRELMEECLPIAGATGAFTELLQWSDWLIGQDMEERPRHDLSNSVRWLVLTAADPGCRDLRLGKDGAPLHQGTPDGSVTDLCAYLGLTALGCPERAETFHACTHYRSGLFGFISVCDAWARQQGVPWDAAEAAVKHPVRTECAL
ncbi:MAG: hypothetical protein ABIO70_03865 [Pseudomonadota bacterium]